MKSYTNIEQSKILVEFLPLESADMRYEYPSREKDEIQEPMNGFHTSSFNWFKESDSFIYFPCWSLAALLSVLPKNLNIGRPSLESNYKGYYLIQYYDEFMKPNNYKTKCYDNPINACYAMILKLHELNLL